MSEPEKLEGMERISIEELKWISENCIDLVKKEEAETALKRRIGRIKLLNGK